MCRICGSTYKTADCCVTPIEAGLSMPMADFEALMYKVWNSDNSIKDKIPYSVVRDFYSDWINGSPVDAVTYLKSCES